MNFDEWMVYGHEKGWISDVFCSTHEVPPMSDEEYQEWEDGKDPCSFNVRVLELD